MKKSLQLFLLLLSFLLLKPASAQFADPVHWSYSTNKLSDCEVELILKAKIDYKWHIYGQKTYKDGGPTPTSFKFTPDSNYELIGKTTEGTPIRKYEDVFETEVEYFENEAVFRQIVKIKTNKAFNIKVNFLFVACKESCIPDQLLSYVFNIDASPGCGTATAKVENIVPMEKPSDKVITQTPPKESIKPIVVDTVKEKIAVQTPPSHTNPSTSTKGRSWYGIFILGFLGGLAALLTPCVFPMIPMTVSYFTKRSKTRAKGISNALKYALAIIVIYVVLGLSVTTIFGSDALNAMASNVWFNLAFFVLLVVFAISFLGGFEIVLPSRFVNKIDSKSDKGGLLGIFFMAFTLSLVSFSCTGPIIGTLLVDAAVNGGIRGPFWGMLGFSTALALPFGLFAAFPGWLNSLPKSGGWLNSVKVVLGFLELALALKFASNADLVFQAHILTREVFIALWIIIFGLMGIYLLGGIRFSHDAPLKHLSVPRFMCALLTLSFTVYLIPGLWGAPLKMISGFPPPDFYSESPDGFGKQVNVIATDTTAKYADHKKEHCPNQLPCFHDYDEALAYSKKVGKPLMIDFTGWSCVVCRNMEAGVWTDPEVDKRIRNEVVLVSLYVDDRNELPLEQQGVKKIGTREFVIKTVGNKWSYMQAERYKTNMQPQYILVDGNEQMLTKETIASTDVGSYVSWLDEGINEFKKRNK